MSAAVGVLRMGMLSSRMGQVHMLDDLLGLRSYKVLVHPINVVDASVGTLSFIYRLASPGVWMGMLGVFFATVVFYASNLYLSGASATVGVTKTVYNHAFVLVATSINQGSEKMFNSQLEVRIQLPPTDEVAVRLKTISPSLAFMYAIWFVWSAFIVGLLTAMLPSLILVEPPKQLPFNNVKYLVASNFTVLGSPLTKKFLLVSLTFQWSFLLHGKRSTRKGRNSGHQQNSSSITSLFFIYSYELLIPLYQLQ